MGADGHESAELALEVYARVMERKPRILLCEDFVITANGKTLIERDKVTIIFTPDGFREIGLFAHIQGPNGLVLRDAGQLVFDANDNLLYARGPHPQFFGETFCPALAP